MSKVELLKKKIGRDDVIILNEELLPRKVKPIIGYGDENRINENKIYEVLGISWITHQDRTRSLGYILINEKKEMEIYPSIWFQVVN